MKPDNPIILALDYSDLSEARQVLDKVRPHIGMVKIGLELWAAHGREALELASDFQIPIFLDLKLHDVPTTVGKTIDLVCSFLGRHPGDHLLSIHCMGGREMCETALVRSAGSNVTVAGVTTLTSLDAPDFRQMGFGTSQPGTRTVRAAMIGYDCMNKYPVYDPKGDRLYNGLKHFITAPNQVPLMKKHYEDSILITPGIRADSDQTHDHARSKPIGFALRSGATWVVIGRPITQASDPLAAAQYFEAQAKKYG